MSSRTTTELVAGIEPVAGEWDELADRVDAPPFLRPGWVAAWFEAFGRGGLEVHAVRRGDRVVAVMPLYRHRGQLRSTTNEHTPAYAPIAEDAVAAAALAHAVLATSPHHLSLGALDADSVAWQAWAAVVSGGGYTVLRRVEHRSPVLAVEGPWAGYEAGLSRSFLADLRRCRRRLEEAGHTELDASGGRDDLDGRLAEVFAVEAAGWKSATGTAIASSPATRRFYELVARWAADAGALRLDVLRLDGRAIAVLFGLESGSRYYALKGGYDPEFRRFSPGKLLLHEAVHRAFADGLRSVELLGDAELYKSAWTRTVRPRERFEAFARSPAGTLGWAAFALGRPLARRVRRAMTTTR
jgi:CelD/BcsL family acetyltransferase involved in cellulose biosynthesis